MVGMVGTVSGGRRVSISRGYRRLFITIGRGGIGTRG